MENDERLHHPQMSDLIGSSTESSPVDGPSAGIALDSGREAPISMSAPLYPQNGHQGSPQSKSQPSRNAAANPPLSYGALTFPRRRHKSPHSSSTNQLMVANERLQNQVARVADLQAETDALFQLVKSNHDKFIESQSQLAKTRAELDLYKLQYEAAQKEIDRANVAIRVAEERRVEAEEREVREREKRRQLQEERIIEQARTDGYKEGLEQGKQYLRWLGRKQEDVDQELARTNVKPRTYVDPYVRRKSPPAHREHGRHWSNENATTFVRNHGQGGRSSIDNRPKSAGAVRRPPSKSPSPPDVGKYAEQMPVPTVTTPLPMRVPSTQPQQQPRPHSSASATRSKGPRPSLSRSVPYTSTIGRHDQRASPPYDIHAEHAPVPTSSAAPRADSGPTTLPPPEIPSMVQPPIQYVQPHNAHIIHHLDDHGPHGEPPEEVHPMLVHNRPPSPSASHRSVVLPPEGYIPIVHATDGGHIVLPPPHELSIPIPAESEPSKSRPTSVADTRSVRSRSNSRSRSAFRPVMMDPPSDSKYFQSSVHHENDQERTQAYGRAISEVSRPSTRISQYELVSPPRGRVIRESTFDQPQWHIQSAAGTPNLTSRNLRATERMVEEWRRENSNLLVSPAPRRSWVIANPDENDHQNSSGDSYGGGQRPIQVAKQQDVRSIGSSTPMQTLRAPSHQHGSAPHVAASTQTSYNREDAGGTPFVQSSPLHRETSNGTSTYQGLPTMLNDVPTSPHTPTQPPVVQLEHDRVYAQTPFKWIRARLKRSKSSPGGVNISVEPPSESPSTDSNANTIVDPVLLTPDQASTPIFLPEETNNETSISSNEMQGSESIAMILPDDNLPPGFVPLNPYLMPNQATQHLIEDSAVISNVPNPMGHFINASNPTYVFHQHHALLSSSADHFVSPMSSGLNLGAP